MDPALIEKITRMVIDKLENQKSIQALTDVEIEDWLQNDLDFNVKNTTNPNKNNFDTPLSAAEIHNWMNHDLLQPFLTSNEEKQNIIDYVKFSKY
ncbi:MAG TPA: hypothetical protein VNU45_09455 [Rummeliibacillus sp.]|nr:hypothetical protein [Rummeliibacillus sp.]